MLEVINSYRNNDTLRHSFNELAGKTFGLNFEDWYQNGFWGDNYNPYSVVKDGRVVANVSVNRTDMMIDGTVRHFFQLGTVMTDKTYQNQGLIRKIMEQIDADYSEKQTVSTCLEMTVFLISIRNSAFGSQKNTCIPEMSMAPGSVSLSKFSWTLPPDGDCWKTP